MRQRFEAEQCSPLQPRLHSRSEAAISSRNLEKITPPLRRLKEKANTGPEGMMRKVREELVGQDMHIPEVRVTHSPLQSARVVVGSGNSVKEVAMLGTLNRVAGGGFKMVRTPEAEEPHLEDVLLDASGKARDAARIVETTQDNERREVRLQPYVTMATDQLNAIPSYRLNPETGTHELIFERKGKPKRTNPEDSLESIRESFQQMDRMAYDLGWTHVPYLIELATVIHNPKNPADDAYSIQRHVVFLDREVIRQIAHTGKFDEYVARANRILQEGNGSAISESTTRPSDVTAIAGGIELRALQEMGAVVFVTGTAAEVDLAKGFPPDQRDGAVEHAYKSAKGHADEILIEKYFTPSAN